ncbi:winged helix-turn-helix domain-containing protein [Agrobacterium sp. B1(2019)]|uniref:ATP-binding protein n=1 Tax=Agrobacterium sp. B1(2019) TaxID=2607032 RepID=UPI001FF0577F|nr:winged helix-turn-helix domain-containing protein [Agrobacterium sp. B1(2019)]
MLKQTAFQFGDFRFLPEAQALLYKGQPVSLGGRGFDILTLLVARAGEVVSKADLFAHVWPDYIVHDHNLKVNVGNLRRALADLDPSMEYIATIAGRGYKFVAALESDRPAPARQVGSSTSHHIAAPRVRQLLGRDDAIHQISGTLDQPGYVTIVGPGGAGKTSLAVKVAEQSCGADEAIAFADLSTLSDPRFVVPAIASALGVSLGFDDPIAGVIDVLRSNRLLLIIDNCEHVIAMAATVVERISSEVPAARIIATSREPLRTRHEQIHFLSGLAYPEPTTTFSSSEALQFPAIQLFVSKAVGSADAEPTDDYVRSVVSICTRLGGLALAIELAAGTASVLAGAALDDLFKDGFDTMNRGARDAPLRHQSLEATLDWSYRLLPDREAVLLGLLSVFSGRFNTDDVEAMYPAGALEPMTGRDALSQLVAKSLVSAEYDGGTVHYRLAESTGAYAARRLLGSFYREKARRQFAVRTRNKLQIAEREWASQTSREWLGKHRRQIDDVRAAIAWAFDPAGDAVLGVELVVAALPLWQELSAFKEMLEAIELASSNSAAPARLAPLGRAKLSTARAWAMTLAHHMHPQTHEAWRESILHAGLSHDAEFQIRSVCGQAVFLAYSGRPRTALRSMKEFAAARGLDWATAPDGRRLLAHIQIYAGELNTASAHLDALMSDWGHLEEGHGLSRFQVDLPAGIRLSQAFLSWLQGDPDRAADLASRAIDRAIDLDHMISLGNAISLAGLPIAFVNGNLESASQLQRQLADVGRRESVGIYEGTATFFAGAIQSVRGDTAGLSLMQDSITGLLRGRWRTRVPFYRSLLAEAYIAVGEIQLAQECLRAVLTEPGIREERWWHPDLWRVAGTIAASRRQPDKAMRYFQTSLDCARTIGAGAAIKRTQFAMDKTDRG